MRSHKEAVADQIALIAETCGAAITYASDYPEWQYDPESELRDAFVRTYAEMEGHDPEITAIHAGLECGLIGAQYPGLDIVSFGPTIHGAHAPGERVEVASVERCWRLLRAILGEISGG